MRTYNLLSLAALAFSALVIPVARGAEHQVTVGGVGVIAYDPEFIVSLTPLLQLLLN